MKKIIYILTMFIIAFTACDPNEEIYDELDNLKEPYHNSVEYTFTADDYATVTEYALANAVTDDDKTYAELIENMEAFNQFFTAEDYVGYVLAELFPEYNKKSSAKVTYNYNAEIPEKLVSYANAEVIEFTSNYYYAVNVFVGTAGYFYPEYNPDFFIPDVLKDSISDAVKEEIYIIKYKYSDVDPIFTESYYPIYFEEKFDSLTPYEPVVIKNWIVYDEVGTETWEGREYDDNLYAQFSAYGSEDPSNISWLITPAVDLTEYSEAIFNFKSKDGYNNGDPLEVLISTDYTGTGDPNTATWVNLNPTLSTGNSGGYASTWVESGDINLDAYTGDNVYVAFKYTGGDGDITTTMQIDDVTVKVKVDDPIYEVTNEKTPYPKYEVYRYSGTSWVLVDDVYHLSEADYDAMGDPGDDNMFSGDVLPQNYLPKFLNAKYPEAGPGITKTIIYQYDSNIEGEITLATEYTYGENGWESAYDYIETTTNQFVHNGTEWLFDPTITFTMGKPDYQFIVEYVEDEISADYLDSYETAEFYYGASYYYNNFSIADGYWEAEQFESWEEAVREAIGDLLLPYKFPDTPAEVNGVDLGYKVIFETYAYGANVNYAMRFNVQKAGPDPIFEYDEEFGCQEIK